MDSDSTDGEFRCMYKAVKNIKATWIYVDALAVHSGETIAHWEYNRSFIYIVEAKIFTSRVKHIDIPAFVLIQKFDNGTFVPKYDNYSFMPADMRTKPCSGPIISWSTTWTIVFRSFQPVI